MAEQTVGLELATEGSSLSHIYRQPALKRIDEL